MILTADIGNSTTTLALFEEGGRLALRSTTSTDPHTTGDQFAIQLFSLFQLHRVEPGQITGGIIASVVPPVTAAMAQAVERLTGRPPLIVGAGIRTGLDIRSDMHAQLGADIVAYCVGAVHKFDKCPKPRVLPIILNVHNRAGISSDKLGYIALCPAFFFSGLFDCQPQPVKIKFFC